MIVLSQREGEVLHLLIRGMTKNQIACDLNISPTTVKCHQRAIMRKLQSVNMVQAVSTAYCSGILQKDECQKSA